MLVALARDKYAKSSAAHQPSNKLNGMKENFQGLIFTISLRNLSLLIII